MHLLLLDWTIIFPYYQVAQIKSLQLIQNTALCVLTRTQMRDHNFPKKAFMQQLLVKSGGEFKILLLTKMALNDQSQFCLKEYVTLIVHLELCSPRMQTYLWFLKSLK